MVNNKDHSINRENENRSVFAILDNIMLELNRTKKIFIFMFFSIMILPITTIIIIVSTLDDSFPSRDDFNQKVRELNTIAQKMKNDFVQLENLPLEEREESLQIILNSPEYKESVSKIDEISSNIDERQDGQKPFLKQYKNEIRIITFILSITWIILGVRQYIILSRWGKRYDRFKEMKKEIDNKFDDE